MKVETQNLSFEEFLIWDDGTDRHFELVGGVPVPLSEPNANHEDVADELSDRLQSHCRSRSLPNEYWIVEFAALGGVRFIGDPKVPTVSVYTIVNGEYQVQLFRGEDLIRSQTFPDLELTAVEIFAAAS